MRLGAPRAVNSTIGQPNPSQVEDRKPYRYKGRDGWEPASVQFREREAPAANRVGLPADHRNSPAAKARRFALYCAARDDGKGVGEAARAAGIAAKTAQSYERERKAALKAAGERP